MTSPEPGPRRPDGLLQDRQFVRYLVARGLSGAGSVASARITLTTLPFAAVLGVLVSRLQTWWDVAALMVAGRSSLPTLPGLMRTQAAPASAAPSAMR